MILIEFKLHNGKVPYFVKDYLSYKTKGINTLETEKGNNRYLGIARSNKDEYLPLEVVILSKNNFKTLYITAKIYKYSGILGEGKIKLTDEEKIILAEEFISKYDREIIIE